jgi:hypothetical protein
MFRKFLEGLVFGTGFSLAFVAMAAVAVIVFLPMTVRSPEARVPASERVPPSARQSAEIGPQFHELPIEEQIKQASAIGVARFEPGSDGKVKAIFREFLKKDPNATLYYAIGDEYPSASFYPSEGTNRGDGVVVFFVGSPAHMIMSMTYTGDRIHSLGDIPLNLFREKCKKPNAALRDSGSAAPQQ